MKSCKYHPLSEANYYCGQCNCNYCDICTDETPIAEYNSQSRQCVRCGDFLDEHGHTSDIEPFWRQLPTVYKYPLSLSGISVLSIFALISSIFPGFIISFILSSIVLINYCVTCLHQTARGIMSPPSVGDLTETKLSTFFKMIVIVFLLSLIINLSEGIFGYEFAVLVGLFFAVTLPAAIIIIVIDKHIFNAINPMKLSNVVMTTGASYFFLCLFIFIMLSSLGIVNQFFTSERPTFINYFSTSFITAYYTVVVFHLMGHVVYQNQKDLGYKIKGQRKKEHLRPEKKRTSDHIETLIKAGDYVKAASLCKKTIKSDTPLWEWERCFKLMWINNEENHFLSFSDKYLHKLSEHKQFDIMGECYLKIIKLRPDYRPNNTSIVLEISNSLVDIGQYKNAILLLKELVKSSSIPSQLRQAYTLLSKSFHNIDGFEKQATAYAMKAARIKI